MYSVNGGPWRRSHYASGTKHCPEGDDPPPEPPEQPESPQPDNPIGNDPDPEDDTPTGNDPDPEDDTPSGNDPDPEEDTTSVTCPDLPDASTICMGRNGEVTCSDRTTRTVAGTKTTSDCPQTWTPHSNTVCYPDAFTQTSSLGDHITKTAFGNKVD